MIEHTTKLKFLDGLRGIASLSVVFSHFVVAFYPALYTSNVNEVHTLNQIELVISKSPFAFFYNGNFSVCIFFVLSAYVLSYKFFKYQDTNLITDSAFRRYIRLEIPILAAILFSWMLLNLELYFNNPVSLITLSNWWLGNIYQFKPNFLLAIKQALWDCFFNSNSINYNPALWTMNYEFLGSFLVFSFLAIFGKSVKRYIVYLILILIFVKTYYLAFLLGLIISDIYNSNYGIFFRQYLYNKKLLNWGLIIVGAIMGSYFDDNRSTLFSIMNLAILKEQGVDQFAFYHIIGAALFIIGILNYPYLQEKLETKVCQFLGRISFSMYLIHISIICSLTSYIFLIGNSLNLSYRVAFSISFILSLIVILLLSYLMAKYIDEPAIAISKKIQKSLLK